MHHAKRRKKTVRRDRDRRRAGGLICAARCGELGLSACLLEKNDRPGKKLLISGSGRCNITHAGGRDEFIAHYGGKNSFVKPALFTSPDSTSSHFSARAALT
jgi:predicted flavoprotein YhiN